MFKHTICGLTRLSIVLLTLGMLSLPSAAQETSLKAYEVELVIFRTTNPMGSPEDWRLEESRNVVSTPTTGDTDEPIAGSPTNTPSNVPAAPAMVTAVGSETSIQPLESARYKLTGVEGTLKRSRSYQPLAHIGWWQPGFLRESPRPVSIANLVGNGTGISGTVTLTRGARLLHLELNLTYQAPDGQRFVLREHRTLRSGDKHYFDHPYFGVVAVVTPKG